MNDPAPPEATPPVLRKDAARNRRRIMDAARALAREGRPVQLNAVAQAADVGVGTVYRHFPTPEVLLEALAADRFEALTGQAKRAGDMPDAALALRAFLREALAAYLQDDAFAAAAVDPRPATPQTRRLRHRLLEETGALLSRAASADGLRPALGPGDMMLLLCGVGYAVRHAPDRDDPGLPERYLDALLDGALAPRPPAEPPRP
ncbi:helix-turn-helix domain containing protein [Sphaerisporangium sp. TRM90804]|uniref:TetR/AcrR family transcriptional regulator n=1 Tax=Sphaerisporangium sp. TRM90804 TaxID=3031113 RepID=UPI002448E8F6|nr:helix-turn-helix domain containing protein [Sphaerisporangium sp. TRM90804]MDH2425911.1 helix-turn-helix domain containing protein [Sphaerisporangium sp. TRM90804]